jgi:hypothetical protein
VVQVAEYSQPNQFGSSQPSRSPDPAQCAQCEAMLPDVFDHTLSPDEQALFDRHLATCPDCSRMFIDAQRGAAWLEMLRSPRPEPPAMLLDRILASTGPVANRPAIAPAQASTLLGSPVLVPAAAATTAPAPYVAGKVLPFRQRFANAFRIQAISHSLMQPRLAMTAAMAFFSIALTLNLTGVRITQLKASDFTPSSLKRSFYDANAKVVRSIDNLRVVYELESRVHDLQRDSDSNNTPAPESVPAPQKTPSGDQQPDDQKTPEQKNQQKQSSPRPRSGSSRSVGPQRSLQYTASLSQPGSSPESGLEPRKSFVIFTPNSLYVRQGGHA